MRIIIFSDPHLNLYKDHHDNRIGLQLESIKHIFEYAYNQGIDVIAIAGDLVHQPKSISNVLLVILIDFFEQLFEDYPNVKLVTITGNHDLGVKAVKEAECLYSIETVLAKIFKRNFKLIDNSIDVLVPTTHRLVGIPYMEHKEDFMYLLEQAVSSMRDGYKYVLLVHQTPNLKGLNIPMDFDVNDPIFDKFVKVFCGHIHTHKHLSDKVTLIGTPYQLNFSEGGANVRNGFLVYDFETNETEFVEIESPKFIEVKEGEEAPAGHFIRVIPNMIESSLASSLVDSEAFDASSDRIAMLEAYYQSEGFVDDKVLQQGISIISKIVQ